MLLFVSQATTSRLGGIRFNDANHHGIDYPLLQADVLIRPIERWDCLQSHRGKNRQIFEQVVHGAVLNTRRALRCGFIPIKIGQSIN